MASPLGEKHDGRQRAYKKALIGEESRRFVSESVCCVLIVVGFLQEARGWVDRVAEKNSGKCSGKETAGEGWPPCCCGPRIVVAVNDLGLCSSVENSLISPPPREIHVDTQ